jgi:competence ComEA-like helix-hairpin-helix protein
VGLRLTTQERRIVVALGTALIVGGIVKLLWRPAPGADATGSDPLPVASGRSLVDVNAATEEELVSLPGVGPVIASRIVAYRDQHGPYQTAADLMAVRGLGPKSVALMESLLTVVPPSPLDTAVGPGLDR